MNGVLIALLFVPFAAGLLGAILGRRVAGPLAVLSSLAALVLATILLVEIGPSGGEGPAANVMQSWIPALGISFHVALNGLNAVLVEMTCFVWFLGTLWSLRDKELATPNYLFMLGLAQTAILIAFVAQDLILFVLCFDLMLLPFVLIAASAAPQGESGLAPVVKLLVYTLVGSLLMLVAAVALAILSAQQHGTPITFDLATLGATTLDAGDQKWILLAFLAAFLIKMPIAPFHGWMPDTYRVMPLPALALFGAVLSKVAAYGFLRIVLPILPDAIVAWRTPLIILALISIIYGSLVAFSAANPRLVLGYSSMAQLGFILLGILALDPAGAQGAVFQSVTHALVVVPAIIIIAVVTERASEGALMQQLGGLARRAPVLAACFLLVALCWLAMPGTGNFVAEYLVLLGQWRLNPWVAIVASIGIVLAAAYALRLLIGTMQNARGSAVPEDAPEMRRFDAAVLGTAIGALAMLSLAPQLGLGPSETATRAVITPARAIYNSEHREAANLRRVIDVPGSAADAAQGGAGISVDPDNDGVTQVPDAPEGVTQK
jgi:NADH-quinone oxidoreductase subunit M